MNTSCPLDLFVSESIKKYKNMLCIHLFWLILANPNPKNDFRIHRSVYVYVKQSISLLANV